MVSISHLVAAKIRTKPFIEEALARGIINYASLADTLIPDLKKELKKEIKHSAVMMALRRLSEELETKNNISLPIAETKELTLKSDLFATTLIKNRKTIHFTRELHKMIDSDEYTLNITEGLNEISIVCNNKFRGKLLENIEKKDLKKIIKNTAALTLHLPTDTITTTGVYFQFLRKLAWENINIIETFSTFTELTIILLEDDATRAYDTLREHT